MLDSSTYTYTTVKCVWVGEGRERVSGWCKGCRKFNIHGWQKINRKEVIRLTRQNRIKTQGTAEGYVLFFLHFLLNL